MARIPRLPKSENALLLAVPELLVPLSPAQPAGIARLVYALGDAAGLQLMRTLFLDPATFEPNKTPTADSPNADALNVALTVGLDVRAHAHLFNGATIDRARAASAAVQSSALQVGIPAVAMVGNWSEMNNPAAGARATITRAAGGAGVRHVCTSIHASVASDPAAATGVLTVVLRDGAGGVGPIIWVAHLQAPAGGNALVSIAPLSIVGSVNTAMTLEFNIAAGGAGSHEGVSLTGYSVA